MKNFKSYDIKCALTHDLQVCGHCKQCGEYPDVRMEMADYVERLEKALDKACEELENTDFFSPYVTGLSDIHELTWKEYLLKESENE